MNYVKFGVTKHEVVYFSLKCYISPRYDHKRCEVQVWLNFQHMNLIILCSNLIY